MTPPRVSPPHHRWNPPRTNARLHRCTHVRLHLVHRCCTQAKTPPHTPHEVTPTCRLDTLTMVGHARPSRIRLHMRLLFLSHLPWCHCRPYRPTIASARLLSYPLLHLANPTISRPCLAAATTSLVRAWPPGLRHNYPSWGAAKERQRRRRRRSIKGALVFV